MLGFLGLDSTEGLFSDIPDNLRVKGALKLPDGKPELSVSELLTAISEKNTVYNSIFRGAGAYRHYIPSIVKSVISKEQFVTAYTPYQAEISQGILQSIFEYQTYVCMLTGMEVSNASVYDGGVAAAEAVTMCAERNRTGALVSAASHPHVIETIKTYCHAKGTPFELIPKGEDGKTDLSALERLLGGDTAAVYIGSPNYLGMFEDIDTAVSITHNAGAKLIMGCNPIALSIMKTPGEYKADIAVGDGQPLGMPLSFGGPYLGFMAAGSSMLRRLPGRIVGQTTDHDGKRGFVLTMQAREQHIRREKASSNICTNQALCALTAAVYLAEMGASGLCTDAEASMTNAHMLAQRLCEIDGFALKYNGDFFHEFVTTTPVSPEKLNRALHEHGILGGLPVGDDILWCATELNSTEHIDRLIGIVKEVVKGGVHA